MLTNDKTPQKTRSSMGRIGKIAAMVFAVDAVYAAGRSVHRSGRAIGSMVFVPFINMFRGWRDRFDFTGIEDTPQARFEHALAESNQALKLPKLVSQANFRMQFWAIAAILFTAVAFAALRRDGTVYEIVVGQHGSPLALAMPFALAFMMWTKAAKWSFWSYQLRSRALHSFGSWLRRPSVWLPPDAQLTTGMKLLVVGAIGGAIAQHTGIGVHEALAQAANSGAAAASVGQGQTIGQIGGNAGIVSTSGTSVIQSLMGNLSPGDLSLQWMVNLFPSFFSSQMGGVPYSQDAVAQMMQVVNTTLVTLGGLLMGWHTVAGVTSTAYEGQVLGQRWHTIWAPIRIGLGVAGTFPVLGYCAGELLAIQLILSGCGLANLAWNTYVDAATGASGQILAVTVAPDAMDQVGLFKNTLDDAVCVKDAEYTFLPPGDHSPPIGISQLQQLKGQSGWTSSGPLFNVPTASGDATTNKGKSTWSFGNACGSIMFPLPSQAKTVNTDYTTTAQAYSSYSGPAQQHYGLSYQLNPGNPALKVPHPPSQVLSSQDQAVAAFIKARNDAYGKFLSQVMGSSYVNDLASSYAAGSQGVKNKDLVAELKTLRADYIDYEDTVLHDAGGLQYQLNKSALTQIAQDAHDLGWASAGALEPSLIAQGARVSSVLQEQPSTTPGYPRLSGSKSFAKMMLATQAETRAKLHQLIYNMPALVASENKSTKNAPNGTGATSIGQAAASVQDRPQTFMTVFGKMISNWMGNPADISNLTPIQSVAAEGANAKMAGYAVLAAYYTAIGLSNSRLGAAIVGGIAGTPEEPGVGTAGGAVAGFLAGPAVGKVLTVMGMVIQPLALWMILIGALLEYVLPILGFVMWVFAIVGYILFCLELVIGTSFWSFAHIRADGNELIDAKQSYGYSMLLVAVFYPTLMVIGLIFANVAMSTMISFVQQIFDWGTQILGTVYDPFGIVIILTVKVILYFQIIIRSYRLITMIPEFVFEYMGGRSPRGNDGHSLGERAFGTAQQRINSVGQQASSVAVNVVSQEPAPGGRRS